ncbi:MAG TPA: metalloregulator ArsR/SmtB family transcription factor [Nitrososphaerales archaeon]|nr:metalloregulator ArsR/SmtB family transcription factor [Nitrososphaerales archaeon]
MLRAFKYIRDPRAFELLADETRRRIIYLLRAKEMTVSQLAGDLHVTTQAVYHQISKLREVGLIEIAREERVDHFIETYYRAAAEVFEFHHGEAGSGEAEKHFREAFGALSKVGLSVEADEQVVKKVTSLHAEMDKIGLSPELEERISQLDDEAFFTKSKMYELAQLALMSDKQFDKLIESEKALRELMTSSVKKSVKR